MEKDGPEPIMCELCQWRGNANGRRQHVITEKHLLKTEIHELRLQREQLEMDLEMCNQRGKEYKEKYELVNELLHAYGVDPEARKQKFIPPRKHKFVIPA